MSVTKLTLLNASILTAYGNFRFEPLELKEARNLIKEFSENENKSIESAIGHTATAEILSELLNFKIGTNRSEFFQTTEDLALIFKLKKRVPEGKVLNRNEIEEFGYEFGLLTKTN